MPLSASALSPLASARIWPADVRGYTPLGGGHDINSLTFFLSLPSAQSLQHFARKVGQQDPQQPLQLKDRRRKASFSLRSKPSCTSTQASESHRAEETRCVLGK